MFLTLSVYGNHLFGYEWMGHHCMIKHRHRNWKLCSKPMVHISNVKHRSLYVLLRLIQLEFMLLMWQSIVLFPGVCVEDEENWCSQVNRLQQLLDKLECQVYAGCKYSEVEVVAMCSWQNAWCIWLWKVEQLRAQSTAVPETKVMFLDCKGSNNKFKTVSDCHRPATFFLKDVHYEISSE